MGRLLLTAAMSLSLLGSVACSNANNQSSVKAKPEAHTMAHADAGLKAVLVYADWCGSCQVLDPKVETAQLSDYENTAFVTLDYTDKSADNFYAAAEAAGVMSAVKAHMSGKIKTGQMLLIDVDKQRVVDVIKKDKSAAEITSAIKMAETQI